MRRLILSAGVMLMVSGCLPPEDTAVADLDSDDRDRMCSRYNSEDIQCEDGDKVEGISELDCIDWAEYLAGSDCPLTIEDWKDMTSDPCSDSAESSRYVLRTRCLVDGFFK